jgi:predicted TIM-barrel fold metal-dependent hydrolase
MKLPIDSLLFDAHLHIIDRRFPLVENQGYLPDEFTVENYLARMEEYQLVGGAVVSGSFQAFDQSYLLAALAKLGPTFVGVTQVPATITDEELLALDQAGVRAVRFNLKRGGSEEVSQLDRMPRRVYDLAGWHAELYVDSRELVGLSGILASLPAVSIDHLGLSGEGFLVLLKLAEKGVRVKATGFGRVDFDVRSALRDLHAANPETLMFGTDLPSTRTLRPYREEDIHIIVEALGEEAARMVLSENAIKFYQRTGSVGILPAFQAGVSLEHSLKSNICSGINPTEHGQDAHAPDKNTCEMNNYSVTKGSSRIQESA